MTNELKNRLLVKYEDECTKMDTDEFDLKQDKHERNTESGGCGNEDDDDDIFFQPPRRISMLWNSKLRWKEERKKVLKISINKLRRIEDPELFLCRSVLINNTVRRLHREIREEKMARYPEIHRPVPVTVTSCSLNHCNNSTIPESFPRKRSLSSSSFLDHKENGKPSQTVLTSYGKESACRLESCSGTLDKVHSTIESDTDVVPVAKRLKTTNENHTRSDNDMNASGNSSDASFHNENTTCIVTTTRPASSSTTSTVSVMNPNHCCDGGNTGPDDGQTEISSLQMSGLDESRNISSSPNGDSYVADPIDVHCRLSSPYARHQQSPSSLVGSSALPNQMCMAHHAHNYNHLPQQSSPVAQSQSQSPCSQSSSPSSLGGGGGCGGGLSSQRANGCCGSSSPVSTTDRSKAKCDQSFRSVMAENPRDGRVVTSSDHLGVTSSTCNSNQSVMQSSNKERRSAVSEYEKQYSQYSCGQLSIFGELQSVVFHSLIASLES